MRRALFFSGLIVCCGAAYWVLLFHGSSQAHVSNMPQTNAPGMAGVSVVSDLPTIRSTLLEQNAARVILVTGPSDVVSRYPAFAQEHQISNVDFSQYSNLPYYLILPQYLVVRDEIRFANDLSFAVMQNVLSANYPQYVGAKPAPSFDVLPAAQFSQRFRALEVQRFNAQIAEVQQQMAAPGTTPAQAQQEEGWIQKMQGIIDDFSNPSSSYYKQSEIITGAFVPPSTILMREPSAAVVSPYDIGELLRVMVHESLHYYAYLPRNYHPLDDFLYEGLTEYLALKAIGYSDNDMEAISGYPLHIQIVSLLAQRIPLDTLAAVDFSQDQQLFESNFAHFFPNTDYQAFEALGVKVSSSWTNAFGKVNTAYVDDPLVLQAKALLHL